MLQSVNLNFHVASLPSLPASITYSFLRKHEDGDDIYFGWNDNIALKITRGTLFFYLVGSESARYNFMKNLWLNIGASNSTLRGWRRTCRMPDNVFMFVLNPDAVLEGLFGETLDLLFDCRWIDSNKPVPLIFTIWDSTVRGEN